MWLRKNMVISFVRLSVCLNMHVGILHMRPPTMAIWNESQLDLLRVIPSSCGGQTTSSPVVVSPRKWNHFMARALTTPLIAPIDSALVRTD